MKTKPITPTEVSAPLPLKVEKGIPLPAKRAAGPVRTGRDPKYPLRKMRVGDSFLIPVRGGSKRVEAVRHRIWAAIGAMRKRDPGFKFEFETRHVTGPSGIRVWRVK